MENQLFSEDALSIIARFEAWNIVSTAFPSEVSDIENSNHKKWMLHNSHTHDFAEFLFALKGNSVIGFEKRVYPVAPGSIFVFNPNEEHDNRFPTGSPDVQQLWVQILRDHFFARMINVCNGKMQHPPVWNVVCTREETGIENHWPFGELDNSNLPDNIRRLTLQSTIAILLSTVVKKGYLSELDGTGSIQAEVVRAIKKHVRNTAGTGAALDYLAHMTGYNKYHLLRVFRKHTGITIHEYADTCRLEKVEDMRAMGYSQARIADELGFACASSFARWYKQNKGENSKW